MQLDLGYAFLFLAFNLMRLLATITSHVIATLNSCFLAHHVLATVVPALGAYGVINMPCTTVGALSDGGSYSHVMSATLGCASLRLSTFRMCHFYLIIYLLIIILQLAQRLPTRVGSRFDIFILTLF